MNETELTMIGNVCADPARRVLDTGVVVTDFRLASSPRRYDRATGGWAAGETSFVQVVCWRALADHVALSLHKGDPVVVHGWLRVSEWDKDGVKRSSVEITASSVGHDLCLGTTAFTAVRRVSSTGDDSSSEPGEAGQLREPVQSAA